MRPLCARLATILLLAFLFLFSTLATTVLIADPTFSNVAFAQKKREKDKDKDSDKNALKGNKRLRAEVSDL